MIGDGLRALGPAEGLPRLPISRMGLIHAPGTASEEARALAEAVRATIGETGRMAA